STRTSSSTRTIRRREDEFERRLDASRTTRLVKEHSCASWGDEPIGRRVDLRKPLSSGPLSLLAIVPIIVLEFSSACSAWPTVGCKGWSLRLQLKEAKPGGFAYR